MTEKKIRLAQNVTDVSFFCSHPMCWYSGADDTARTHTEEVDEETVAQWIRSITGARNNPRGAKRILPFDAEHPPGEVRHNLSSVLPFVFNMPLCIGN